MRIIIPKNRLSSGTSLYFTPRRSHWRLYSFSLYTSRTARSCHSQTRLRPPTPAQVGSSATRTKLKWSPGDLAIGRKRPSRKLGWITPPQVGLAPLMLRVDKMTCHALCFPSKEHRTEHE